MGEAQGRWEEEEVGTHRGHRAPPGSSGSCPAEGAQSLSSGPVAMRLQCPEQAWHTEAGVGGSTRCIQSTQRPREK